MHPEFTSDGASVESNYTIDWGDGTSYDTSHDITATEFDHSYAHGGTAYDVEAFLETSVGVLGAEAAVSVSGSNPITDPGSHDTGFSLINATTGGSLPATTGDTVQAHVFATMDPEFSCGCSTSHPESVSGDIDFGNSSGFDGFTFNNTGGTSPSSNIDYSYSEDGQYLITMTATDGSEETRFATVDNRVPIMDDVPDQVAGSGQSFSVTENYSNMSAELNPVAFVNWGDGTGQHVATLTHSGTTGTITASTSSAPAPGVYTATLTLYPMGPTGSTGSGAPTYAITKTFTLYSWGVVIDSGESNDTLIASPDGTHNQQAVTLVFPHPAGEAFSLHLSSSNASQNYLFNSSGTKLTPSGSNYPAIDIASGDTTSSITYEDGAIEANSTAGILQYTLNAEYDAGDSTTTFQADATAGCGTVPTAASVTQLASQGGWEIKGWNDPNGDTPDATVVSNGVARNWLVGQVADLRADWIPAGTPAPMGGTWSISGNKNVISGIKSASNLTNVTDNSLQDPANFRKVGGAIKYNQSSIQFGWVATTVAGAPDNVTATYTSNGGASASAAFTLYSPEADADVVYAHDDPKIGNSVALKKHVTGQVIGMVDETLTMPHASTPQTLQDGIGWSAQVLYPVGFPAGANAFAFGSFGFTQKVNPGATVHTADDHRIRVPFDGFWVLDGSDPFPGVPSIGWITGTGYHAIGDLPIGILDPKAPTSHPGPVKFISIFDAFNTFVMFTPPAANKGEAFAVPMEELDWNFSISAQLNAAGNDWNVIASHAALSGSFTRSTVQPQWDNVVIANPPYVDLGAWR